MRVKTIPIVRRTRLADGNILQNIVGASSPEGKKLQFPYEIPPIKTVVDLHPDTKELIKWVVTGLGTGALLTAIIRKL